MNVLSNDSQFLDGLHTFKALIEPLLFFLDILDTTIQQDSYPLHTWSLMHELEAPK